MDIFRRLLDKKTGKGGVHCYCCNWSRKGKNSNKKKLNKIVRQILKRDLKEKENE